MVLEIPEMGSRLEIVASGVRDDTMVQDVKLTDTPAVETLVRVEAIEYGLIADLYIADASSDASNLDRFWDSS